MFKPITTLLILVIFVSLACSIPTAGNQTPTAPSQITPTVGNPLPTSPAPAPTDAGNTPGQVSSVRFYLVAIEDKGASGPPIGCGDSLVAVDHPVEPTNDPIRAALERLFSFKEQYVGESGLYTALYQSNLQVQSTNIDANGVATVELVGDYKLGGTCDAPRFQGQIEQTVMAAPGVSSVNVLLNGVPIQQALSAQ